MSGTENRPTACRGLSLLSGGLDSQLAVCVLREAGAEVEGVTFTTPFFDPAAARKAAAALGVKLHEIDFTADEIALVENPPHGFGGAMNPCIDCHATMIKRAGELMAALGYDFVATGEVVNQRPMSQNRQSLGVVEKCSGLAGRLVRPLSAQLLAPTIPETEGKLDRSKLLGLQGRRREEQFALAKKFGLVDYPSPAGGCKLTEKGFGRRLRDLMEHEGLGDRRLVELLLIARRFRFPDGTGLVLGRDARENDAIRKLRREGELLLSPVSVPGPTALVTTQGSAETLARLPALVAAWSKYDKFAGEIVVRIVSDGGETRTSVPRPYARDPFLQHQIF
ncbi:MAG: asparagine synthase-related protein [Kiritimatiellae bacterium]|nr:asparagine synthase-related protein [Kiritimatiellia bacterium]